MFLAYLLPYVTYHDHLFSDSLTSVTAVNLLTNQEIPVVISAKTSFENYLDTKIGMQQLLCNWNTTAFNFLCWSTKCFCDKSLDMVILLWTLELCSSIMKKYG